MIHYGPAGPTQFGVGPSSYNQNNPYDLTNRFINNLNNRMINMGQPPYPYQYGQGLPGYNTGYYTGNYNMQNPYYQIQEQQRIYQEQLRMQINQDNINEKLVSHLSAYTSQDIQSRRSCVNYSDNQYTELQKFNGEFQKTNGIGYRYRTQIQNRKPKDYVYNRKMEEMIIMDENHKEDAKYMDEKADLYEFMENGYKINVGISERERVFKENNLRQLYNQDAYHQLLNMHNGIVGYQNNYDNIQPISIDDYEVSLPSNLAVNDEYKRRREAFINTILAKSKI